MKSDLPKLAFYFLQRLSAFFNGFLTFFNGFPLSPTAFQISSTAFHFPRNPRKSIYGEKYTKDHYSSFVFFATCSPSYVITAKQYLHLTQHVDGGGGVNIIHPIFLLVRQSIITVLLLLLVGIDRLHYLYLIPQECKWGLLYDTNLISPNSIFNY
jgi:hypothetical protein